MRISDWSSDGCASDRQPDIIQAKPVGIEGGAVYMKHASQTGELILMSLRPWRDIERRKSRQIMIGNVPVGGDAPVTVQTMTNTLTSDARATIDQIRDRKSTRLNSSH